VGTPPHVQHKVQCRRSFQSVYLNFFGTHSPVIKRSSVTPACYYSYAKFEQLIKLDMSTPSLKMKEEKIAMWNNLTSFKKQKE
jgi:hypothetical protein